jgi:hypothetical protein
VRARGRAGCTPPPAPRGAGLVDTLGSFEAACARAFALAGRAPERFELRPSGCPGGGSRCSRCSGARSPPATYARWWPSWTARGWGAGGTSGWRGLTPVPVVFGAKLAVPVRLLLVPLLVPRPPAHRTRPAPPPRPTRRPGSDDLGARWSIASEPFPRQGKPDRGAYEARLADPPGARRPSRTGARRARRSRLRSLLDVPPPSRPAGRGRQGAGRERPGPGTSRRPGAGSPRPSGLAYTPERLARDFQSPPGASERLSVRLAGRRAAPARPRAPRPAGRYRPAAAVRVVLEDGLPRVAALE